MTIETVKTKPAIYLGESVKVVSAKETFSFALSFPKMFPGIRKVEETVSRSERIVPKITCIAFSFVYRLPSSHFLRMIFTAGSALQKGNGELFTLMWTTCISRNIQTTEAFM